MEMGACHPVECIGSTPAGPAVADGLIFVGSLGHLTAFPADCLASACEPVWTAHTNAIAHQAVVADGVVYVGTGDGSLYAFPVQPASAGANPLGGPAGRQRSSLAVSQVQDRRRSTRAPVPYREAQSPTPRPRCRLCVPDPVRKRVRAALDGATPRRRRDRRPVRRSPATRSTSAGFGRTEASAERLPRPRCGIAPECRT